MKTVRKIALPVQYVEVKVLQCDGCGTQVDDQQNGMLTLNWHRVVMREADETGGVRDVFGPDFCADCWPKVSAAVVQESKAIAAERLAAVAEVKGIA